MFGFNDSANLDKGSMWPVAYALPGPTRRRRAADPRTREEGRQLIASQAAFVTLSQALSFPARK